MSAAVLSRPLVSLALPEKGIARYAALGFLAVAGTLLLTVAAKTKVVLGPVDLYLGNFAVLALAAAYGSRPSCSTSPRVLPASRSSRAPLRRASVSLT